MKQRQVIATVECPNCQKQLEIVKEQKILSPSVKAIKEEKYFANLAGVQTKL